MPCSANSPRSSCAFILARTEDNVLTPACLRCETTVGWRKGRMQSARTVDGPSERRIGVYGWGVVAPGARDVRAFEALLQRGGSALVPSRAPDLGQGLFPVGDPDFSFDDYAGWIIERRGEAYLTRMRSKM